ncbi:type II toxin-antitoxin system RelB/DinJ family antitoxin [uncultured Adlercreutzia sp.]|uniref:type II toxin-antitoxin system RelB/DinJ family antitoxin n=1 Tax=uncultured Adlercreutzia sp. TaxID=875803 RepID=UPI0026000D56|nr:translation repressor RelB [uncultured Adlercreutzia sp.]
MMSQMNVRMNEKLRIEGNLALEEVGWSPSQATRALWGFAARNRRNPNKLREMQRFLEGASELEGERPQPSEAVLRGPQIIREFREKYGLPDSDPNDAPSYEELREEALYERYRERDLL